MRHARTPLYSKMNDFLRLRTGATIRIVSVTLAAIALTACEQNTFVPPPPPKVEVAVPAQKNITRFIDATVDLFVRFGSTQWTRIGEYPIARRIVER